MGYWFEPPYVTYRWPLGLGLTFPQDHGKSVIVKDGVVTVKQYASEEEAAAADFFYRGGTRHFISDSEAAVLAAAGLSDRIEGYA